MFCKVYWLRSNLSDDAKIRYWLLHSHVFARLQMTLNATLSLSDLALVYHRLESSDRDLFRFEDPTHSTCP